MMTAEERRKKSGQGMIVAVVTILLLVGIALAVAAKFKTGAQAAGEKAGQNAVEAIPEMGQ